MKSFAPPKRKLIELLIMLVLSLVFYFFYPNIDALILFLFGFVWNWAASNDLTSFLENRRNRMSMLKLVVNLQALFLKPFAKAPSFFKKFVKALPAGIFWSLVIYINDSEMPWWSTFIGSVAFELLQFEIDFIKRHKEIT